MTTLEPVTAKRQLTLLDAIIITLGYYDEELLTLEDLAYRMKFFLDSIAQTINNNSLLFSFVAMKRGRIVILTRKGYAHLEELTAERGR